jgi:hypothetical protein
LGVRYTGHPNAEYQTEQRRNEEHLHGHPPGFCDPGRASLLVGCLAVKETKGEEKEPTFGVLLAAESPVFGSSVWMRRIRWRCGQLADSFVSRISAPR